MLQFLVCCLLFYNGLAAFSFEESSFFSNEDEIHKFSLLNVNATDFEERSLRFTPFPIRQKVFAMGLFRKLNWFQAEQFCAAQGMTLASIASAEEGEQMRRLVYESNLITDDSEFWISGTDLAENRNFYWFGNGRPFIYTNWASGEPNNLYSKEHCVMVNAFGKWADVDCNLNKLFICENRCPVDSYSIYNK